MPDITKDQNVNVAPAAVPAAPAAEQEQPQQIDPRIRIAALERDNEHWRKQYEAEKTKAALADAKTKAHTAAPQGVISNAQQDARRQRCVTSTGGPAFWGRLTLDQRLAAKGEAAATPQDIADAKRVFRQGDSALGNTMEIRRYKFLRSVAQELP